MGALVNYFQIEKRLNFQINKILSSNGPLGVKRK